MPTREAFSRLPRGGVAPGGSRRNPAGDRTGYRVSSAPHTRTSLALAREARYPVTVLLGGRSRGFRVDVRAGAIPVAFVLAAPVNER